MELKVIKCPNCGANTTNAENCEYCGSLLVRFADKGIVVDTTKFTAESYVYPGLLNELKRNLKFQRSSSKCVVTDIRWIINGRHFCINVMRPGYLGWMDGTPINIRWKGRTNGNRSGLCVVLNFDPYTDSSFDPEYNRQMNEQLSRFKAVSSFPLFTSHTCTVMDSKKNERYAREYAIDFGQDAEGAAALIGEILNKVKRVAPSDNFSMLTNSGYAQINAARDAWLVNHGFKKPDNSKTDDSFLGFLISLLRDFFHGLIS